MFSNNVIRLKEYYQHVYQHKMNDMPISNNKLTVEVVGFTDWGKEKSKYTSEVGILITPWFMNIILLPKNSMKQKIKVGTTVNILFPDGEYSFLIQSNEDFGIYLTCSLFSPMFDFKSQTQTIKVAKAVMQQLLKTKKFKQIEKDKQTQQQYIKNTEILNKISSRRAFLKVGSNVN